MLQPTNLAVRKLATLFLPIVGMIVGASVVGELASEVHKGASEALGTVALDASVSDFEHSSSVDATAEEKPQADTIEGFGKWSDLFQANPWAIIPPSAPAVPGDMAHRISARADAALAAVRSDKAPVLTETLDDQVIASRAALRRLPLSLSAVDSADVIPQRHTGLGSEVNLFDSASNGRAPGIADRAFSGGDAPRIDSSGFGGLGSSLSGGPGGSSSVGGAAGDALGGIAGGALKGLRK
jgi:hypothetical protein